MTYSEEFKEKCKTVYPDWNNLHDALEKGSEFVGRYLCDSRREGIPFDDILNADSLEELQEKAKIGIAKRELYSEWLKIYNSYC